MVAPPNPGKFTVYRTSTDFVLDGKPAPEHPMVLHPRHMIFLPISDYLYERSVNQRAADGSVLDEAYILCAWLNHLYMQGLSWKNADNDQIKSHAHAMLDRGAKDRRVQRCVNVIFQFYWIAQNRLGLIKDILENPDNGKIGPQYPISVYHGKNGIPQGLFQFTTLEEGPGRPTPEEPEVERILDHLLARENVERATCFWLSASLMHRAGLREQGVAALTLGAIATALKEEGIHLSGRAYSLQAISREPDLQNKILSELGQLGLRGRSKLFIRVTEKRRRTRDVGVSLDLFEHLLFYIWTARAELVATFYAKRRRYKVCDALFLSLKTGCGLQKKSIGNLVNATFKTLQIPGSAHRLRAAFAESVVRECYLRARGAHGVAWDRHSVLLEAAEALGHKSTRNLRSYLNRIMRELELVQGDPVLVTSPSDVDDVRAMISLINSGNTHFANEMRSLLAEHGHNPQRAMLDSQPFHDIPKFRA